MARSTAEFAPRRSLAYLARMSLVQHNQPALRNGIEEYPAQRDSLRAGVGTAAPPPYCGHSESYRRCRWGDAAGLWRCRVFPNARSAIDSVRQSRRHIQNVALDLLSLRRMLFGCNKMTKNHAGISAAYEKCIFLRLSSFFRVFTRILIPIAWASVSIRP